MFMNENSGRLEVKPIEDVARLELGPERIEEIIRHETRSFTYYKTLTFLSQETRLLSDHNYHSSFSRNNRFAFHRKLRKKKPQSAFN